jgi:hypothetical protein
MCDHRGVTLTLTLTWCLSGDPQALLTALRNCHVGSGVLLKLVSMLTCLQLHSNAAQPDILSAGTL